MRKTVIGLATSGVLLASGVAVAQQSAPAAPTPPAAQTPPPAATPAPAAAPARFLIPADYVKGQKPGQTLAKDRLIGAKVHNREGQIIGDIEDLIINQNNQVVGVIMGIGGFLGVGEKKVGVQYYALQFTQKDGKSIIVLPSATKAVLSALLPYQRLEPKKSIIERGKEKAQELTDKSKETAKDAAATAKEKAGPALEKAKESAGQAYEKAKEATGTAVEKAKEAVKEKK